MHTNSPAFAYSLAEVCREICHCKHIAQTITRIPLFLLICVFMANSLKMKLAIGILMVMGLMTAVAAQNGRLRIGRFLVEDGHGDGGGEVEGSKAQTCSKYPYMCSAKNSGAAGPNCCDNKCVNVLTNSNYCGSCNVKCQFASGCCNGKCANLAYDAQNCGTCGNKCKQGVRCVYGMCNYA